ncbi:MAG TPA: phosphate ABC transporter, permease protein PstA, partial [Anaerolineae bacterium]|nr:phosphate ABC transporter, permease protein PstA [Anaerolineae bacterium]
MSRQQTQRLASVLITLTAVLVFVPVIVVIVYLIWQGIGAISWEFLTQPPRNGMTEGGIWPAILGTLILTMGTALVSMPFSIATAIYLAE